jgi:hypothetical protein
MQRALDADLGMYSRSACRSRGYTSQVPAPASAATASNTSLFSSHSVVGSDWAILKLRVAGSTTSGIHLSAERSLHILRSKVLGQISNQFYQATGLLDARGRRCLDLNESSSLSTLGFVFVCLDPLRTSDSSQQAFPPSPPSPGQYAVARKFADRRGHKQLVTGERSSDEQISSLAFPRIWQSQKT